MPDGRRRSREHWADAMEARNRRSAPAHTHRLPPVVRISVVGLVAAVFLLLSPSGCSSTYVYQQQQYIQGKGVQRDAENARLQEQIRQSMCDLLDQLPEGGLLQRPREKYGCGPGIPLADLPPAVRDRYAPTPTPAPTLTPLPPAASPSAPVPAPGTLPPRTGPGPGGPTPSPDPTPPPLRPVTDLVCDLTAVVCN
jgi:hypothetical protein